MKVHQFARDPRRVGSAGRPPICVCCGLTVRELRLLGPLMKAVRAS